MQFGSQRAALDSCNKLSVQYKNRAWDIDLGSASSSRRDTSTIAVDLQAALNLSQPPVGLRLRVAAGEEAVVCPLSVLVVCPSYIATTFQGMSWVPLMGDATAGTDDADASNGIDGTAPASPADPVLPPPLGSPLEHGISSLATCESATSPSEGCGRPLTAPPGDRTRGLSRQRPSRREGMGRPMSATPSDKLQGMRRFRPAKSEGFGRPATALPSDHSDSGDAAWGLSSPHGFGCDENAEDVRPATVPTMATAPTMTTPAMGEAVAVAETAAEATTSRPRTPSHLSHSHGRVAHQPRARLAYETRAFGGGFTSGGTSNNDFSMGMRAASAEYAVGNTSGGDIWASGEPSPPRQCWL